MISKIQVTPGNIVKVYSRKETLELEKKWLDTFCQDKKGANTKDYKWHIFSYERYPSLSKEEAIEIYNQQEAPEYIILSNEDELAIQTDLKPTSSNLHDYYIFPKNMAWTMAFTHEDGWLGPYFAKHPEYDKLNEKNYFHVQKLKEIEKAKKNGWF